MEQQESSEIPVAEVAAVPEIVVPIKTEPAEQIPNDHEPQPVVAQPTSNDEYSEPRIECTTETQENDFRTLLTKCVFCEKNFTATDNSKLLECLHAACASCVDSKLNDNASADVEVLRK